MIYQSGSSISFIYVYLAGIKLDIPRLYIYTWLSWPHMLFGVMILSYLKMLALYLFPQSGYRYITSIFTTWGLTYGPNQDHEEHRNRGMNQWMKIQIEPGFFFDHPPSKMTTMRKMGVGRLPTWQWLLSESKFHLGGGVTSMKFRRAILQSFFRYLFDCLC